MKELFDYGNITDEQKKTAEEITALCESMNQPMIAEMIRQKFNLVTVPKYNMEESPFVHYCSKENIFCAIQGHIFDDGVDYQVVSICADIRNLNKLVQTIKEN